MPAHRKPTALKLLHGNRKATINTREPRFVGLPICPQWLHPRAKAEWKRVLAEFADTGLITAVDGAALAAYCQAYARWRQAEEQVSREGQMVKEHIVTRSGNPTGRYRTKKHPAVTIARDERAAMIAAGRLFGFDPTSRTRVLIPESPPDPVPGDDDDSDLYVLRQ